MVGFGNLRAIRNDMTEEEVKSEQDKDYPEGFKDFCALLPLVLKIL